MNPTVLRTPTIENVCKLIKEYKERLTRLEKRFNELEFEGKRNDEYIRVETSRTIHFLIISNLEGLIK